MKNILYLVFLTVLIFSLSACSNNNNKGNSNEVINNENRQETFENISPKDAKKQLDEDDKIILLDVRTQEEYDESHIPKSKLIPVDVLDKNAESELKDKESKIFVYCRSGNRSVTASEILIDLGYTNVYNLGGIIDWPYETE
ncbi:MAG: rhodanese-like domain-containing protein [Clostridiales bacterium]